MVQTVIKKKTQSSDRAENIAFFFPNYTFIV